MTGSPWGTQVTAMLLPEQRAEIVTAPYMMSIQKASMVQKPDVMTVITRMK
jgi:hypothetical protein